MATDESPPPRHSTKNSRPDGKRAREPALTAGILNNALRMRNVLPTEKNQSTRRKVIRYGWAPGAGPKRIQSHPNPGREAKSKNGGSFSGNE